MFFAFRYCVLSSCRLQRDLSLPEGKVVFYSEGLFSIIYSKPYFAQINQCRGRGWNKNIIDVALGDGVIYLVMGLCILLSQICFFIRHEVLKMRGKFTVRSETYIHCNKYVYINRDLSGNAKQWYMFQ